MSRIIGRTPRTAKRETIMDGIKQPLVEVTHEKDGYVLTSPLVPELVTCGATLRESLDNLRDALTAVLALYKDQPLELRTEEKFVAHG